MSTVRLLSEKVKQYRQNILVQRLIAVLGIDLLVKLSGIILLPAYLRLMSQEEYGLYNYLLSIILTFSVVLNFGLYVPLSKFYHDYTNTNDQGKLLFTLFLLLTGIFVGIIFPFYFFDLDYHLVKILFKNQFNYTAYRGVVLLAVALSVFNFMLTNFFFTSEKIGHIRKYNLLRIVCINAGSLLFLFIFNSADGVWLRLTTTYLAELVLLLLFSYFAIKEMKAIFDVRLAIKSLKFAMPVMISAVFGIVINFSDKFFLEKYGSFENLSPYYLGISCASIIPMAFTSFQNAWLPIFLKEKNLERNIAKTKKILVKLLIGFLVLSCMILLFMQIMLALDIIQSQYSEVMNILPILLLSQIVAAIIPLYSNYLVYLEKTYIASVTGFIICIINLGLSLLLIPLYGIYGAASVTLISNIFYLAIYFYVIKGFTKRLLITPTLIENK